MSLTNLNSYKDFLNKSKPEVENYIDESLSDYTEYGSINEGLFGFLGNMFKNLKQFINKIKGGEKVQNLYIEYLKSMNDKIKNIYEVDMKLTDINSKFDEMIAKPKPGEEKKEGEPEAKPEEAKPEAKPGEESQVEQEGQGQETKPEIQKESRLYLSYLDFINEAVEETEDVQGQDTQEDTQGQNSEQEDFKIAAEVLKKNRPKIASMMKLEWKKSLKKMLDVLKSTGGAEKNPKLNDLINDYKSEIEDGAFKGQPAILDNVQLYFETKGGMNLDASAVKRMKLKEKEKVQKLKDLKKGLVNQVIKVKIEGKEVKLKVGGEYRYNSNDGSVKGIKIVRKSEKPDKVFATFTFGDNVGKEQEFTLANIDINFKPEKDKVYKIYNDEKTPSKLMRSLSAVYGADAEEFLDVKVITDTPDKDGNIDVGVGKDFAKKFKITVGKLLEPDEVQGTQTQDQGQEGEYEVGKIYKCKTDSNGEVAVVVVSLEGKTMVQRLTEPNTVDKPMPLDVLDKIDPFEPKSKLEPLDVDEEVFKEILDHLEEQLKD